MPTRTHANHKVEFRLSQERLVETTWGEIKTILQIVGALVRLQQDSQGNSLNLSAMLLISDKLEAIDAFLAKFVARGPDYLPPDEARPLIDQLTVEQIITALMAIGESVQDVAVPPASGADSAGR